MKGCPQRYRNTDDNR